MNFDDRPFRSLSRDERRQRILWAAKTVFFEKGVEQASMDDVAARAGTTKPTVYAHFKSKDELFSGVLEMLKGYFLGRLGSPDAYSAQPVEAITFFCGRLLELFSWRDVVGFQRVILAGASRTPDKSKEVYETLFTAAWNCLAVYLQDHNLTDNSQRDADLLLSAAIGLPLLRSLYGAAPLREEPPGDTLNETRVDLTKIREAVALFAAKWKG